ncbi:MAG: hypothetical protein Q8934_00985 [Bacillota bacterium]|nr:hypothetical protein [Bacillota bacterium]
MSLSNDLTQKKLQEILLSTYIKVQENQNIQVKDIIEEIKQSLMEIK